MILLIHCLLPKFSDFGKLHNPVNIRGLLSMRRAVSHAVLIAATLIFMIATSANAADSDATKRLFEAVWANDLGAVRRVVAEGVDPFATDSSGMAPVDVAVDRGYFDIAHYLLAVQNQRIQGAQNLSAPPSPPETTAPVAYAAASTPIAEPTPEPAPEPIIAAAPTVPQLPPMPAPMPAQAPQTIQMGPAPVTDPITEPVIEPAAPIETVEEATQAPEPPIPPQQTEPASVAVSEPPAENQNESSIFQRLSSFMKGESVQESAYSEPVIEPEKVEVEAVTVDPAKEAKPETTSTPAQPQQVVLMSEPTTETVKTDPLVTSNEPDALDRIVGFLRDSTAKLETAPEESQEATKAPEPEPEPVEPVKITEKAEAVSEAPKTTTEPEIPKPKTMSEAVSDAISELVEPPVSATPKPETTSIFDQLADYFSSGSIETTEIAGNIANSAPPASPETVEIIANEAEPVPLRRYLPQQVVSANTTPVEVPEASKVISEPPIEAETPEPPLEPTAVEPRAEALQIAQQKPDIPPAAETTTASASSEPPSEKPAAEPAKVAASPIENTPSLLDQLTSFFTPDEPEQLASPVEITEAEPAPPPAPLAPETAEIIANEAEPVPLRRYLPQQVVSANTTPVEVPEASKIISEPPIEAETLEPSLEPTAVEPRAEALQIAQQAQGIPPASETTTASTSSAPPSEGPAAEPDTVAASPTENTPSLLDQLQGFFTPDEAEQPASPVEITEAEPTPETAVEEIKKQELPVETANVAITKAVPAKTVTSPPAPKIVSSSSVLRASAMTFGDIGHLGKKLEGDRIGGRDCVEKAAWGSYFCIENIDWPETITPSFGPPSYYMGGGRAIVRYDGGQASQYHVLFPSRAFNRMAQYFKNTYGPPSETPEVWTAMLGEPKRYNKTMRWRAPMTDDQGYLIIEIREIDDLRWSSPPDTRHGVARLYREGARTVFELLTTADLLLMQVRQGAYQKDLLAPVDGKSKG